MLAADIDISPMDFWALPAHTRQAAFATLRAERPLGFFTEPDMRPFSVLAPPPGRGYYAVTRHADLVEISRNAELFSSAKGALNIVDIPDEMIEYATGMLSTDNPRHARLRRIVSTAFSPRTIRSIEGIIQNVTNQLIDDVAPRGGCDVVASLAAPLPLILICDLMGLPASRRADVLRCSNIMAAPFDPDYVDPDADTLVAQIEAIQELRTMATDLATERLANPTTDLTTALVTANIDGESLTPIEIGAFFVLLLVAGNETTRNAISHGLVLLTEHPDQRALWQADPTAVARTGVEEIVRYASPVHWMRRTVTRPTTLSGVDLAAGDKMLLFYGSANRDEAVFDDPNTFDVRRSPNPHVGFGAAGPHFCLGAHLARMEIDVMLRTLLERLPDIQTVDGGVPVLSRFVNGIKTLECTFTPRPALA